jgi:hypothetical protein
VETEFYERMTVQYEMTVRARGKFKNGREIRRRENSVGDACSTWPPALKCAAITKMIEQRVRDNRKIITDETAYH